MVSSLSPNARTALIAGKTESRKYLAWSNVYRMESPRVNGPGQKTTRLNVKPLREPQLVDQEIGPLTRCFDTDDGRRNRREMISRIRFERGRRSFLGESDFRAADLGRPRIPRITAAEQL